MGWRVSLRHYGEPVLRVATDGSSLGNPGPSGWAWATENGQEAWAGARRSTNNRMELRAVIEALESLPNAVLLIVTDSEYVVNVFTEWLDGWRARGMRTSRGKPVENQDLIERAAKLLEGRNVEFEWVRGHAGHPLNERADKLANDAAQRAKTKLARQPN